MVIDTKTSLVDTWNAMIAMKKSGKVRRYVNMYTQYLVILRECCKTYVDVYLLMRRFETVSVSVISDQI